MPDCAPVCPELRAARDVAAETAAAIAVIAPRLSIACSGCVLGVYLAGALLMGWTHQLLRACLGLVPHGVLEIPAMVVSAAVGICIAARLVSASSEGLRAIRVSARQILCSPQLVRIMALILAAIVIGAAIEVRTMQPL